MDDRDYVARYWDSQACQSDFLVFFYWNLLLEIYSKILLRLTHYYSQYINYYLSIQKSKQIIIESYHLKTKIEKRNPMQRNKNFSQNTLASPQGKVSSRVVYNSTNPNSNSHLKYNNNINSNTNINQDQASFSSTQGQQYQAVLKNVGYVIGEPIPVIDRVVRPTTPLGEQFQQDSLSRNSRMILTNGAIVHDHPSRPVRSPSPIYSNPSVNVVPHTKFIYNASSPQIEKVERVVFSQTPPKYQAFPPIIEGNFLTSIVPSGPLTPTSNSGMVPRSQYENCVNQCRNWQKKYSQLYSLYIKTKNEAQITNKTITTTINNQTSNMLTRISNNNNTSQEYEFIARQNRKLKERIRELQRNQNSLTTNMDDIITNLVNKYKDSTLKECMLLTDRYRLQKKMNQK